MTPGEIADRLQIQDLLARYCHTVDRRDWTAFRDLFTADAVLDFTAFGGPRCGVEAMCAFLRPVMEQAVAAQHTIGTMLIELDGDTARASSTALVPLAFPAAEGPPDILFSGLWYHDRLVRTAQGWRIRERVQQKSWSCRLPLAG